MQPHDLPNPTSSHLRIAVRHYTVLRVDELVADDACLRQYCSQRRWREELDREGRWIKEQSPYKLVKNKPRNIHQELQNGWDGKP